MTAAQLNQHLSFKIGFDVRDFMGYLMIGQVEHFKYLLGKQAQISETLYCSKCAFGNTLDVPVPYVKWCGVYIEPVHILLATLNPLLTTWHPSQNLYMRCKQVLRCVV